MRKIYAVHDIVGDEIMGPLVPMRADAAAIRMFSELLADKRTQPGQHPADYQLLYLGHLAGEELNQTPNIIASLGAETIITGAQWLAMQEKSTGA